MSSRGKRKGGGGGGPGPSVPSGGGAGGHSGQPLSYVASGGVPGYGVPMNSGSHYAGGGGGGPVSYGGAGGPPSALSSHGFGPGGSGGGGGGGGGGGENPYGLARNMKYKQDEGSPDRLSPELGAKAMSLLETAKGGYHQEIRMMMFTFGDVKGIDESVIDLMAETMKEFIQILAHKAVAHAVSRGSRFLTMEDVAFQLRRDVSRLHRLLEFLSWKDVRKRVDDSKGEGGDDADIPPDGEPADEKKANIGRTIMKFSWDLPNSVQDVCSNMPPGEDVDLEVLDGAKHIKLKIANDKTISMTPQEYQQYTEARQASFTFKKLKKFREWLVIGDLAIKPNDDIIEVFGFLALDCVTELTLESLRVRNAMDAYRVTLNSPTFPNSIHESGLSNPPSLLAAEDEGSRKALPAIMTQGPPNVFTCEHLREAARRLGLIDSGSSVKRRNSIYHL